MKSSLFLSIIIPAYNEEQRLPGTLKSAIQFLQEQDYTSEIIIVNDGSTDKTIDTPLPSFAHPVLNIHFIHHHKNNHGKGAAVRTGVLAAQGKLALLFDADNSTPVEEINKLLPAIKNSDIAIGSRHLPDSNIQIEQPWHRRFLSRAANKLIQLVLLPRIIDTQCGFKLFKTEAAKAIFSRATVNRWGFDMEILFIAKKLGYSIKEIPVTWLDSPNSRVRPIKGALNTLRELGQIRINDWKNRYS
ncbi:MAG: glycosyltransferase family 2 protein [Nanoarchaeota archaeon]|nr:glycosyltransferase family 2 protein [Nanoarchaeota archaeon]